MEDYLIIRSGELSDERGAEKLARRAGGLNRWALVAEKTERVLYRKTNEWRHGIATELFCGLVALSDAVFADGITVYLGINEAKASETLFASIPELSLRKTLCCCDACRSGNKERCWSGSSGMTFFPVTAFKSFKSLSNNRVIVKAQPKVNEPEQMSIFQ